MKETFAILRAEIKEELSQLEKVRIEYEALRPRARPENPTRDGVILIGFHLHSFYNGCENILRLIARFFENDLTSSTWHTDLLKRMMLEIEGIRPRVIDRELFKKLDDFRRFRHVFRSSYSFELDGEKLNLVARLFDETYENFVEAINGFLDNREKIIAAMS